MGYRPEVGAGVADVDLSGTTALVTGSTAGLGRETALALGRLGATVLVHGRDRARGERVCAALGETRTADAAFFPADFESLTDVRRLADRVADRVDELDVLVHNAGAWYPEGRLTADGVEATFAVNHLAPFLLTDRLRPLLCAAGGRVVTVSSGLHRRAEPTFEGVRSVAGYDARAAYARSKLANVLFTLELADRTAESSVTANCLDPGPVPRTRLARRVAGPTRGVFGLVGLLAGLRRGYLTDHVAHAATTSVYLAVSPAVADVTGGYFARCERRTPATAARDRSLGRRLWEESERLTAAAGGEC